MTTGPNGLSRIASSANSVVEGIIF